MAMEVSALAASGQRLLEALEASRTPAGSGLTSNGPSPVPQELADEFARLLESALDQNLKVQQTSSAQRPDGVRAIDPAQQTDQATQVDAVRADSSRISAEDLTPTPEKLIQLQFELGGFVMKARAALAANTGIIQNFESTLRAQN